MKKILFVDDSPTSLLSTKIATNSLDFDIIQYQDSKRALDDLINYKIIPDLMVLDFYMPEITGLDILKKVRGINEFKSTPIIMLTTESKENIKKECQEYGLTGWMVKPFNSKQLVTAITRVLRV
jgi:two-component system chemotaxis response regulator CheY